MQKTPSLTPAKRSARLETPVPTREQIATMAYQIFLLEGRPEGCHLEHWLEAEAQLLASPPLARTVS